MSHNTHLHLSDRRFCLELLGLLALVALLNLACSGFSRELQASDTEGRPALGSLRWVEFHDSSIGAQFKLAEGWTLSTDTFFDLRKSQGSNGQSLGKIVSITAASKDAAKQIFATQMAVIASRYSLQTPTTAELVRSDGSKGLLYTAVPQDFAEPNHEEGVEVDPEISYEPLWAQAGSICVEINGRWHLFSIGVLCHAKVRAQVADDLRRMLDSLLVASHTSRR